MEVPTAQIIERYLRDLAYGLPWLKIKPEFNIEKYMQDEAFEDMGHNLRGAYLSLHQDDDGEAALTHLLKVSAICKQRLTPAYLLKYNTAVSYFQALASRAGTPVHDQVHDQGALMQNLLLRVYRPFGSVSQLLVELKTLTFQVDRAYSV